MNLQDALPIITKAIVFLLGIFGGAQALETMLENYIMDHAPAWLKPLIVPFITFLGAVVASVYGGVPLTTALAAGLAGWGFTVKAHNDIPELPPVPASAA